MLDLEEGGAELVFATLENKGFTNLDRMITRYKDDSRILTCSTIYPNLAADAFLKSKAYRELYGELPPALSYLKGGERPGNAGRNFMVQVLESDGHTESALKEERVDIILEVSQSGGSLRDIRAVPIGKVMDTSAHFVVHKDVLESPDKIDYAARVARNLDWVAHARRHYEVKANFPRKREREVNEFLKKYRFYGNEPTIVKGRDFHQLNVLIKKGDWTRFENGLYELDCSYIIRNQPKQIIVYNGTNFYNKLIIEKDKMDSMQRQDDKNKAT